MTTDIDNIPIEEYWKYLLEYMDEISEALDSDDYFEEPFNDRNDDV